jgi:SAM-dependent methyltransferase
VRVFEYEVTAGWLQAVFGRSLRPQPVPPEALQIRVAGAAAGQYQLSGGVVADQIVRVLADAGRPADRCRRVLDFGCGPGRVISAMRERLPNAQLFGSDIDAEAISWAQGALSDVAEFHVNRAAPPLPFPDDAFDLVYSISTFTHLPADMQWRWLAELRRVIRPGGLLLTTKLDPGEYDLPLDIKIEGLKRGTIYWDAAAPTEGLPDFYRLAYHTHWFVEREWSRYFDVLRIGSHDLNNTQDAVLLRRPRHALSWLPAPVRKRLYPLLRRSQARRAAT